MLEAVIEGRDLPGPGALLGSEDRRCPLRSKQRIVDVAGDDEFGAGQFREARSAWMEWIWARALPLPSSCRSVGVAEAVAQGGEHSHAAVGAGASAQRQDDPGRVEAEGEQDRFAEAAAGGVQRFQLSAGQERQAAGVGDLDDGGGAVERDAGLDGPAGGSGDGVAAAGEAGGDGGVHAAVPSVGQGKQFAVDRPGRRLRLRSGALLPGRPLPRRR